MMHVREDRTFFAAGSYPAFLLSPDADKRACNGADLDLFFPERGDTGAASAKAKTICARCPFRVRCRSWALSRPVTEVHGIWGGMTHAERERAIRGKCPRCSREVRAQADGMPARHKTLDELADWVWCG